MYHCKLVRILWGWQLKGLPTRFHQVSCPIVPFDYGGQNVILDFEVNIRTLAPNVTLE